MTVYLPSGMDEFAPLTLEEAVYQAIGAASVCWEDVAKAGVFDSDRAKAIGDALLTRVRGELDEVRDEAHRMVEAARADANARWSAACEEYGACVPEGER